MRLRSKVVGVPEAAGALEQMGEELGLRALVAAAMSGAMILVNRWKKLAPYKTGTYKRSIHAEVTKKQPGYVEVTVGSDIVDPPYPFFLEFGTSKMAPHPSARPAFDQTENEVAQEIEEALMEVVDHHWR